MWCGRGGACGTAWSVREVLNGAELSGAELQLLLNGSPLGAGRGGVRGVVKLPRRVALPCRVQALGGGWLNVIVHTRNGGFAEETVLIVHQVLVDTGSGKTKGTALTRLSTAAGHSPDPPRCSCLSRC